MKTPSFINSQGLLYQDDCIRVMAEIKSNAIDCVFADPPFNLRKNYLDTNYTDEMDDLKYDLWTKEWIYEAVRILKPGGSLFIYHMPSYLLRIGAFLNEIPVLTFRNWIAINMKNSFPIKKRLHPAHYGLLYYIKKGGDYAFNVVRTQTPACRHCGGLIKDYGGYRNKFKKWEDDKGIPWIQISDFWDDSRPVRHDKKRPLLNNELPYEIPERAILFSTQPDDIVFDPFGGGGSTYYAAHINSRYWLGTEIGDTKSIINYMFFAERKIINRVPRKLRAVFRSNKHSDRFKITEKRRRDIAKILKQFEKAFKQDKKENGRYSHRMTNKVFGD